MRLTILFSVAFGTVFIVYQQTIQTCIPSFALKFLLVCLHFLHRTQMAEHPSGKIDLNDVQQFLIAHIEHAGLRRNQKATIIQWKNALFQVFGSTSLLKGSSYAKLYRDISCEIMQLLLQLYSSSLVLVQAEQNNAIRTAFQKGTERLHDANECLLKASNSVDMESAEGAVEELRISAKFFQKEVNAAQYSNAPRQTPRLSNQQLLYIILLSLALLFASVTVMSFFYQSYDMPIDCSSQLETCNKVAEDRRETIAKHDEKVIILFLTL